MRQYETIYHYINEDEASHEWKVSILGDIGFLVLDDMEVRGVSRFNDNFFNKYADYIVWM